MMAAWVIVGALLPQGDSVSQTGAELKAWCDAFGRTDVVGKAVTEDDLILAKGCVS